MNYRKAIINRKNAIKAALTFFVAVLIAMTQTSVPAWGQVKLDPKGTVVLSGDFRLRAESDWDSRTSAGVLRSSRDRARIRLRVGANWTPAPFFSAGVRARSGSLDSQQSPHVSFKDLQGNATGDQDILLDKWFVQAKRKTASVWAGRNSPAFWKQNELFWDDDATVAGVGAAYRAGSEASNLSFNAGTVALPDGGLEFAGWMHSGQAVYAANRGAWGFTGALGFFRLEGSEKSRHLRNGNGGRDYSILVGNLQARTNAGNRTLTVGFDVMHNAKDYDDARDAYTIANRGEKDGFVISALWGRTSQPKDWQAGYYYAWIETLSVNASFAQDDWIRWGSANQTDASDFKGHELRFVYVPVKNMDIMARLYLVEAITSVQDGKRFRIDLNYKF